jgi:hypothetical protein
VGVIGALEGEAPALVIERCKELLDARGFANAVEPLDQDHMAPTLLRSLDAHAMLGKAFELFPSANKWYSSAMRHWTKKCYPGGLEKTDGGRLAGIIVVGSPIDRFFEKKPAECLSIYILAVSGTTKTTVISAFRERTRQRELSGDWHKGRDIGGVESL